MAFPSSPVDGQLYTNALGTQYHYVLADTAWKIVGGGGGGGTIKGSGTPDYLAMFYGDSTTLSTSPILEYGGALSTAENFKASDLESNVIDTGQAFVRSRAASDTTCTIEMYSVGYNNGFTNGGPDGTSGDGGVGIQASQYNNYIMINQPDVSRKIHLTVDKITKLAAEYTGVTVTPTLAVNNSPYQMPSQGCLRVSSNSTDPYDAIRLSAGLQAGTGWTEDTTNSNILLTGKGLLDNDGTVVILPSHTYAAGTKDHCYMGKLFISLCNVGGNTVYYCGDILELAPNYSDSTTASQWISDLFPQSYISLTATGGNLCILVDSEATATTNATVKLVNLLGDSVRITYKFEGCIVP